MKNKFKLLVISPMLISVALFTGCGDSDTNNDENKKEIDKIDNIVSDTSSNQFNGTFKIGGQIFSVPSPVQTAFLIKDVGIDFNSEYTNPSDNAVNYSTNFQKALNLGVYGADLGYLTIYEQTEGAMKYLKSVRSLSGDLGLEGAFDEELANRFSENIGNQDSMLVFVSEAYKKSDNYLKDNDKDAIAALVLAGGWIESVYIAADASVSSKHEQLIERLGDQKVALSSLIKMLGQYSSDMDYNDLVVELEDLYSIFEEVEYNYEYVPPVTDAANKVTTFKSKHTVNMGDSELDAIKNKIESIRTDIVE